MCRGRRVTQQDHISVAPFFAQYAGELNPSRTADMTGIGHQLVAAQVVAEYFFADRNGVLLAHRAEPESVKGLLRTFDNECRGIFVKLIGMNPDPAMVGLFEDKGECIVKFLVRAHPDKGAFSHFYIRFESLLKFHPGLGIKTVTGDDQIIISHIFRGRSRFGLELQVDAQTARTVLQDQQQRLATYSAKSVSRRPDNPPPVVQRDIIPIGKMAADLIGAYGIVLCEIIQSLVRQNHTPTKGIIGFVALKHGDFRVGQAKL